MHSGRVVSVLGSENLDRNDRRDCQVAFTIHPTSPHKFRLHFQARTRPLIYDPTVKYFTFLESVLRLAMFLRLLHEDSITNT